MSSSTTPPTATSRTSPPPAEAAGSPTNAAARLQRELVELMTGGDGGDDSAPQGVTAFPQDDDLFRWAAQLRGPDGTCYEGIEYNLTLSFPPEYPFRPPKVRFVTPCFHPNVDINTGGICLDVLADEWTAVLSVASVLVSLQSLLASPNCASPLNNHAAQRWNDSAYIRSEALRYAGQTASDDPPPPPAAASTS